MYSLLKDSLLINYSALLLLSRVVQNKNAAVYICAACCNTENTHIHRIACILVFSAIFRRPSDYFSQQH